jgi:hypothetical protein
MMLVIHTQYTENYGSPDEPYWKMKGGSSHKILNVPVYNDKASYQPIVDHVEKILCHNSDMSQEYVEYFTIEPDTYLSWFEKSQMEFDGKILYPETAIEYSDLMKEKTYA